MKKYTIILLLINFAMFSQNPVYNLSEIKLPNASGAYYKDNDNDLSNFVGTWLYTNSVTGTTLKIVLRKIEMQLYQETSTYFYYEDILVGTYQYLNNNAEVINTLPSLNDNIPYWHFGLNGNEILSKNYKPVCPECSESEKRVELTYTEPDRVYIPASIIFRRFNENGDEKIKIKVLQREGITKIDNSPTTYTNMKIPYGDYVLTKQ